MISRVSSKASPTKIFTFSKLPNFSILSMYLIIPVLVHWNVLTKSGNNQLGQPYFESFKATDLSGSIRNAWILRSMEFPWSREFLTNYPDGEIFWRWQNFSQLIQLLFQWIYTRIGTPAQSVALITIIGWATTSLILYSTCRSRGVSQYSSILAGFVYQILPAVYLKATTETSMMYAGLVLLAVNFAQDFFDQKNKKSGISLVSTVSFLLFFDPYLFYMSVFGVLIVFAATNSIPRNKKRIFFACIATAYTSSVFYFKFLANFGEASSNDYRPLIPPHSFVQQWLTGITPYMSPPREGILGHLGSSSWNYRLGPEFLPNLNQYLGLFVIVISIIGLYSVRRISYDPSTRYLGSIMMIFFLVTIDTSFKFPFLDFWIPPLADIVKYGLPGVRIFSRFGLVAGLILLIFLGHGFDFLVTGLKKRVKATLAIMIFLLIYFDLATFSQVGLAVESMKFQSFTTAMKGTESPVILQIPFPGRSWTDSAFLFNSANQIATINPLYSSSPKTEALVRNLISQDQKMAIQTLNCLGATYIIAETNPDAPDATALTTILNKAPFRLLSQISLPGGDSSYKTILGLYSVPKEHVSCN